MSVTQSENKKHKQRMTHPVPQSTVDRRQCTPECAACGHDGTCDSNTARRSDKILSCLSLKQNPVQILEF